MRLAVQLMRAVTVDETNRSGEAGEYVEIAVKDARMFLDQRDVETLEAGETIVRNAPSGLTWRVRKEED